jgi:peptidoglycan/xylan/chitin deacetylase (PgdA/CDA1 family)
LKVQQRSLLRAAGLAMVIVLTLGSSAGEARRGEHRPTPRTIARSVTPPPPPIPLTAALQSPSAPYAAPRTDVRIRFEGALTLLRLWHFSIDPHADGRLEWADLQTLRFQPDRLAFDTTYTVQMEVVGYSVWEWTFTTKKAVTFSFDDCPWSASEGQRLLAILRDRHIKATMFPTGLCQRRYPWLVPAMLADGHTVCNHTYSHPHLSLLTDAQIADEIRGGVHANCSLFRPPYGDWDGPNGRVARIAKDLGYQTVTWEVDTLDWSGATTSDILRRINERGGLILLHMWARNTFEVMKTVPLDS